MASKSSTYVPADIQAYLAGYPGKKDNLSCSRNLHFYSGEITSRPKGDFIDNIHKTWWGQYDKLEMHHGYIQWLFPIQEHGLNMSSQELYVHERDAMVKSPKIMERLETSYCMMLDFYGLKMTDATTGVIERADNWKERFANLASHSHNFLRITRILKCLGEMGLERWKVPLLERFVEETYVTGTLASCAESLKDYWINTVRDSTQRARLQKVAFDAARRRRREGTELEEDLQKRRKGVENSIPQVGPLPRLLQGCVVWLHPKMSDVKREIYSRWIVGYGGDLSSDLVKGVTHALIDSEGCPEGAKGLQVPRGVLVLDSDWLLTSHKKSKKLPEDAFLL